MYNYERHYFDWVLKNYVHLSIPPPLPPKTLPQVKNFDPESSLISPDVSQSLLDQSFRTMGVASLTPDQLTAHTHVVLPPDFDPAESLHALGEKVQRIVE